MNAADRARELRKLAPLWRYANVSESTADWLRAAADQLELEARCAGRFVFQMSDRVMRDGGDAWTLAAPGYPAQTHSANLDAPWALFVAVSHHGRLVDGGALVKPWCRNVDRALRDQIDNARGWVARRCPPLAGAIGPIEISRGGLMRYVGEHVIVTTAESVRSFGVSDRGLLK
jgi:hypothetical protein